MLHPAPPREKQPPDLTGNGYQSDPTPDLTAAIAAVNQLWRDAIDRYAAELTETWDRFSAAVDAIDDEGDMHQDFVGDLSADLAKLRRLGVRFDPHFVENFLAMMPDVNRDGRSTDSFTDDEQDDDPHGHPGDSGDVEFLPRFVDSDSIQRWEPISFEREATR